MAMRLHDVTIQIILNPHFAGYIDSRLTTDETVHVIKCHSTSARTFMEGVTRIKGVPSKPNDCRQELT